MWKAWTRFYGRRPGLFGIERMEANTDSVLETRFVLPADVLILPISMLSERLRKQIPHAESDFAVSRPRVRRPSQVIDADTAKLLTEFQEPSRIAEAVARYSRKRGVDPFATLVAAFDALQSLMLRQLLVPWDSELARIVEASFVPGQQVGEFEITRLVQALEDTELYQATFADGSQTVALKITRPSSLPSAAEMLAREAAVLRHLQGAPVPQLVAHGRWEERRFLACEWRSGLPVSAVAAKLRNAASGRDALHRLCVDVGAAFACIHERRVVHGDVHPGNILSGASICLLDFGLSRWFRRGSPFTSAPRSGVAFYYEPELAQALLAGVPPPEASFAGEQYALAVLLYQLLTGHYPFDFTLSVADLLPHIISAPVVPFSRRGVEPWPEVESPLAVAMSKDPAKRFSSVREFMAGFRQRAPTPAKTLLTPPRHSDDASLARFGWDSDWFKNGLPGTPTGSFCHGATGVAYFIYRVALIRDDPALLALADSWSMRVDPQNRGTFHSQELGISESMAGADSPYHTAAGLDWVRALIAHARGDAHSTTMAAEQFMAHIGSPTLRMDLFLGSPGAVLAGSRLYGLTGIAALLEHAGRFIDECAHARWPNFGGVAHGAEGASLAALQACHTTGRPLPAWLAERLEALAALPLPDYAGWCRGTAGLTLLWTLAHRLSGSETHLRQAERAAARTWNDVARDSSLCCGLAGRGFALLRFYRHTGAAIWLDRARRLADLALRHADPHKRRPWSLFQGRIGVALLKSELDAPELGALPLLG